MMYNWRPWNPWPVLLAGRVNDMKYKIEKGSVQETLLIPLYGRKMAMDLYPDLFADKEC